MPIGLTSSCTDTVSPRSCTLDCTLVFVCGTHMRRMCGVRARVALAHARVCMQGMIRPHVEMKCKEKNVPFIFIAPMHSYVYVTNVFVYN